VVLRSPERTLTLPLNPVQYTELRDGVQARPARRKEKAKSKAHASSSHSTLCSAPVDLVVKPAAAAGFRLLSEGPVNKRLMASNDSAPSRVLLSDVVLQLIDRYEEKQKRLLIRTLLHHPMRASVGLFPFFVAKRTRAVLAAVSKKTEEPKKRGICQESESFSTSVSSHVSSRLSSCARPQHLPPPWGGIHPHNAFHF